MAARSRPQTTTGPRTWFGLAVIEVCLLSSASSAIAAADERRGWWVTAAVVTQLLWLGAVWEAVRHRERAGRRSQR